MTLNKTPQEEFEEEFNNADPDIIEDHVIRSFGYKPACNKITELEEIAWGIIANAGGGDWDLETPEWKAAAIRWRDEYHAKLDRMMQDEGNARIVERMKGFFTDV
jgi:hypothetical protein